MIYIKRTVYKTDHYIIHEMSNGMFRLTDTTYGIIHFESDTLEVMDEYISKELP